MANRVIKRNNANKQNKQNEKPKIRGKMNGRTKNTKFIKGKIQDARQRIILKKRKGVTDARDILTKIAKGQDARSKLDKIRGGGVTTVTNRNSGNIKVIGSNIVRKTDRNGKISLTTTNKVNATNNIKLAIERELGLNTTRTAVRPAARRLAAQRRAPQISPIRKQIVTPSYRYETVYEPIPTLYKVNPAASQVISTIDRPLRRTELVKRNYENFSISRPIHTRAYIDLDAIEDEEMPMELPPTHRPMIQLQGTTRSSNIHSRLDSHHQPETESHGIFAQAKTKVVVPAGHRIVVSNLQGTVSQEDIKELFEDIGDLLAARLVRPGVAEVIYKNLKDAQKAVDTYHNRQLDGQPMKCLLVNKRPLNNPTAPALPKSEMDYIEIPGKMAPAEKLIPDISTIHKVLFQRN